MLLSLNEEQLLQVMEGVPTHEYARTAFEAGADIVGFLAESGIFPSKGEARKMVQSGGISINKSKVEGVEAKLSTTNLLNNRYLLVQKGKKNYYLVKAV